MKSKLPISTPLSPNLEVLSRRLPPKRKRSHKVAISLTHVYKSFLVGGHTIPILKNIDLSFYSGEFAIIYGPSGCGKSTILHTILGLEEPTEGSVSLRGEDIYRMTPDERTNWRREKVGMVFQQSNWIKALNVWENVAYPLYLSGWNRVDAEERARQVLTEIGMEEWASHRPTELSGGQQQRVSLARAIATDPWILIADEPTGNLDSQASNDLMELLVRLNRTHRRMILMVTHDLSYLPLANRRIAIKDGFVIGDEYDA